MKRINTIFLPITIIVASVIIGGFYYATQVNKQESIERQQQVELFAKKELEEKEYIADQKSACLNIYKTESDKWGNVRGWNYNVDTDKCEITYNDPNKKSRAECEQDLEDTKKIYGDNPAPSYAFGLYLQCLDGTFVNEF